MKTQCENKEEMLEHIENTVAPGVPCVIYSGNYIPTMENFPASHWKRKNKLDNHVGTIFVNNQKYKYILTKKEDGSFYWQQLIKKEIIDIFIQEMNKRKIRRISRWKT